MHPRKGQVVEVMLARNREVKSLESFIEIILGLKAPEPGSFYFRGESDDYGDEACIPSLFRKDFSGKRFLLSRERQRFNEACRRCPETLSLNTTVLDRLVEMQHYGLETRLLDVTESPLVALYFAVCDERKDVGRGCVYCIHIPREHVHYSVNKDVQAIAKIVGFKENDVRFWRNISKQNRILFFKPPFINSRIQAQQGAMLIFGCGRERKAFPRLKIVEDFSEGKEIYAIKLEIPVERKRKIRDELKKLGISQWTLFPKIGDSRIKFY